MTEKQLGTATVSGGIARTNYTIPSDELIGDFTLHGTYVENNHYREATDTADFRVRVGTTITVDNVTGNTGESSNFTAHVLAGNSPVNEGQVQFKLEGNIIGTANVSNGVATLAYTIPGTAGDGDSITANYLGTSTYGTSVTVSSGTLHIRSGVTVTVDAVVGNREGTVELSCLVEDGTGNPITGTSVDFYLDNTLIGTDSTADATSNKYSTSYTIPSNAVAGVHTIRCVSAQTGDHLSAEGSGTLRVRMPVTVTVEDASVNIGGTTTLVAHVLDENNAPATSGKGVFKINGKIVKDANDQVIYVQVDSNGTCTLSGVACPTGTMYGVEGATSTIDFNWVGGDNYESVSNTDVVDATLTVRKTPVLIVSDVTANRGDTIYLSTSVTYNNENVTEGTVTFILEQT
jgi:hypothetical protein